MNTLTLQLPSEIYESLARRARQAGRTPEAIASEWVTSAVGLEAKDPLLQLLGTLEAGVTDVAQRHDEYIGRGLSDGCAGE